MSRNWGVYGILCVLAVAFVWQFAVTQRKLGTLTMERDDAILKQRVLEKRAERVDAVASRLRLTEETLRHETEEYKERLGRLREENNDLRALLDTPVPAECLRVYPPPGRTVPPRTR